MDLVGGILGGSALPDGDTATNASKSALYQYQENYGELAWAMREEVHRILYIVVNSNAMNGYSSSTRFITVTPEWIRLLNGAKIGISISFGISVVIFGTTIVFLELEKRKKNTKDE